MIVVLHRFSEGKLDGDIITFVEPLSFNGNDIRIEYTGKINGDQIKFTRKVGEFATEELVAKRSKIEPLHSAATRESERQKPKSESRVMNRA